MTPRVVHIEDFNRWLSEVRQLARCYNISLDPAELGWVGRYQRGLTPGGALEEYQPHLRQLDLFLPPPPR